VGAENIFMQKQQPSRPHATKLSPQQAIIALRALHKRYARKCGPRFRDIPFSARTVPGWIYNPKTDALIKRLPQELSGSVVLSTGATITVRVVLDLPTLTRAEQHELHNVRLPLHDLTPHRPKRSSSNE
jgi:hypothetical protein